MTTPATNVVPFVNTDSVPHEVTFANGACSLTLAPGQSSDCPQATFYVGSYAYTVDGKYAGTVVATPLARSVTLTASTHSIRRGTSLTLHGRVHRFVFNPFFQSPQTRLIVLARPEGHRAFKTITAHSARVWRSGSAWKLTVRPCKTTTYIAKAAGQEWAWSDARSSSFTVRVRHPKCPAPSHYIYPTP